MKERPILFSGEMVRAILADEKTQTRRIIKGLEYIGPAGCENDPGSWGYADRYGDWYTLDMSKPLPGRTCLGNEYRIPCRYGEIGDRLWVREKMRVVSIASDFCNTIFIRYEADGALYGPIGYPARLLGKPVVGKCLSYGGYREASRITLEITGVRAERVQEISEADAKAEGTDCRSDLAWDYVVGTHPDPYAAAVAHGHRIAYRELWDKLNAKRGYGWKTNPWVWVIEFRRATGHTGQR